MSDKNKNILIFSDESSEYKEFNLTPGFYKISYPSKLKIKVDSLPDKIYIGCDANKENQFGGCVDELKILSESYTDFRSNAYPNSVNRSITKEYLDPSPQCPDSNTNVLIPFDDPFDSQVRSLKRKEFLDSNKNLKYRLSSKDVKRLSFHLNDENMFISEMINMGFGMEISKRVFYEVHKADGGPIKNIARYYPSFGENVRYSSSGPNELFNGSGRFIRGYHISLKNSKSYIDKDRFTIEMWVSPEKDTYLDGEDKVLFDTRSVVKKIKKSKFNKFIELDQKVSKVLSVRLLSKKSSSILSRHYDEVEINNVTGRLNGGGGVGKDYSYNYKLINNEKTIVLSDKLPQSSMFVEVMYVPKNISESYINIKKTAYGAIKVDLFDGIDNHIIEKQIRWKKNTWHRLVVQYSYLDMDYHVICDGSFSKYNNDKFPKITGSMGKLSIGADYCGNYSCNSKISNIRVSDIVRYSEKNSSGEVFDPVYNRNLSLVTPVTEDLNTNLFFDFKLNLEIDNEFSILQNPKTSIYSFDVNISDNYNILKNYSRYDLLIDLIERLKPSHANAKVNSYNYRC